MARVERSFKQWFYRSGWFFLLIGCGGVFYFQAMREKCLSYSHMNEKLQVLNREKADALAFREELLSQIHSQSDPAWVEIVLKRNLGMVKKGEVKVYFQAE